MVDFSLPENTLECNVVALQLWSLGKGPNIVVKWETNDGDKLTFPAGVGFSKTIWLFGKPPIRFGCETQYADGAGDSQGPGGGVRQTGLHSTTEGLRYEDV